MRRLQSTLIVLLLGLTTVAVVGALLLTLLLPTLLQRFACAPYGIRCAIGQAGIRPHPNLTADLVIDHLALFDPDSRGVALRVKRLAATLNIWGLIFTRRVMPIEELRIEGPELLLRQLDDGRWNLVALAQEVQQHLQPVARPTGLQLPRTALIAGTLQFGGHRVTDMNVTVEPKPAPVLFEMQAQAAVMGRSIQVSGNVRNTFEGQIQAQVRENRLRGAVRFRVDQSNQAVAIPEWLFEADSAMARGKAIVRYAAWPPTYTLTVAEWGADLGALAQQLSFPWLSGVTGLVEGEPTTLQGHWPDLPVGHVVATLKDGRLMLPPQQVGVTGLIGDVSLQHTGNRLRLQAGLRGKALELLGQRYSTPSLQALVGVDTTTGDVIAETLRASIAGMQIKARGSGRRWGYDSFDLTTTELRIEPVLLAQLAHWGDGGISIARLVDPSIHLWRRGATDPWRAEIGSRSIRLQTAAMNDNITLQNAQIAITEIGLSARRLEGTLSIEQADLAGRRLRALSARIELDPDHVRIPELHLTVGDGDIRGHASLSRTAPGEMRVALSVRSLSPQSLVAPAGKPADTRGVALDADLSADATSGGSQSLATKGRVIIRHLSLSPAHHNAEPVPPIIRLRGSIPFALDKGLVAIPETTLQEDGGLVLSVAASLPVGGGDSGASRVHLSAPWTEAAALRAILSTLTGGRPDALHLAGQVQADLEVSGGQYHGTLALQNVGIRSQFFRLDGATGVIPLYGRIDQGPTVTVGGVATQQKAGRSHHTESDYRAALERLSHVPDRAPFSLTINSVAYDPIAIHNIEFALASSGSRIVIRRFAFQAWDGRWSGWGTVEPMGGGVDLALLTEGLSLRAICDAFPPITGYISGRINGMADLTVPRFALDQARGNARFWAVDSPQETRKISRELIEQLAGQRIRYFSLFGADRRYDRGVLDIALNAGDLTFHELDVSHTTLGYKDLDVRVSPTFNKIGLTHLLESISEAIERIRASAKPNH